MPKLAIIAACLLGLSACTYTERDVALVPAERQVITTVPAPAPVTGTTVYRSYEVYDNDDRWLLY